MIVSLRAYLEKSYRGKEGAQIIYSIKLSIYEIKNWYLIFKIINFGQIVNKATIYKIIIKKINYNNFQLFSVIFHYVRENY